MNIHEERKAVVLIHDLLSLAMRATSNAPFESPIHAELNKLVQRAKGLKHYSNLFGALQSHGAAVDTAGSEGESGTPTPGVEDPETPAEKAERVSARGGVPGGVR